MGDDNRRKLFEMEEWQWSNDRVELSLFQFILDFFFEKNLWKITEKTISESFSNDVIVANILLLSASLASIDRFQWSRSISKTDEKK